MNPNDVASLSALGGVVCFVFFVIAVVYALGAETRWEKLILYPLPLIVSVAGLIVLANFLENDARKVNPQEVVRLEHGWAFRGAYVPYSEVYDIPYKSTNYYCFWKYKVGDGGFVTEEYPEEKPTQTRWFRVVDRSGQWVAILDQDQKLSSIQNTRGVEQVQVQMDAVFMTEPHTWIRSPQSSWAHQEDEVVISGHLVEWVAE